MIHSPGECRIMIIIFIIVTFIAFGAEGRGRGFFVFLFFSPLSFLFGGSNHTYAMTNSALWPSIPGLVLGSHIRSACIACVFLVSECWFLDLRDPTWISKIMGLVTTQDMNLYKMYWPSSLACSSITVSCVRVCDVWLPRKASKENLESRPSFSACSSLSRMFSVTN